ncbi:acyl carrier protein [Sorangium sp. So ce367]|uniref:acyl carrier protein n=1 Tax=Sorangium sp. So ce367 TaxID=3133305 RepID=UPI003F6429FA
MDIASVTVTTRASETILATNANVTINDGERASLWCNSDSDWKSKPKMGTAYVLIGGDTLNWLGMLIPDAGGDGTKDMPYVLAAMRPENDEATIRNILTTSLGVPADLGAGVPLSQSELESTKALAVVMSIEQKFGIKVASDEIVLENFGTIANIVSYVSRKKSK